MLSSTRDPQRKRETSGADQSIGGHGLQGEQQSEALRTVDIYPLMKSKRIRLAANGYGRNELELHKIADGILKDELVLAREFRWVMDNPEPVTCKDREL